MKNTFHRALPEADYMEEPLAQSRNQAVSDLDSSREGTATDAGRPSRRNLLKVSTLVAGGSLAGQVALPAKASAQEPQNPPRSGGRGGRGGAPGGLNLRDMLVKAREQLYPTCMVCPVCDGVACSNGGGAAAGAGTGMSFQNNFTALQRVKLVMHNVHDEIKVDTSTTIFGHKLSLPAVCAPMGPGGSRWGKGVPQKQYFDALVGGYAGAGTLGAVATDLSYALQSKELEEDCRWQIGFIEQYKGRSLYNVKPLRFEIIRKWIPQIVASGPAWVSMDVDSGPKSVAELRELVKAFDPVPFVVKGLMTLDDALKAIDAGAKGIVVSNHGGRSVDHNPGTAQVLPAIAAKLKGKIPILVDGCVQTGIDVLKYLALGADVVLVGRASIRALYGGGTPGVTLFVNSLRAELQRGMRSTGVPTISKINDSIITV